MELEEVQFYLAVPEVEGFDRIEISKQEIEVIKEEVYDIGAQSCRIK